MKKFKILMTPVTYNIPFSFKDPKGLRSELLEKVNDTIVPSKEFIEMHGESDLAFLIVLERKTKDLKILGPTTGDDLVDYTFWLPYKRIKESENIQLEYLKSLKTAILEILVKYNFDIHKIIEIFEKLESKYANLVSS